jgi:DNA-binding GntR family transcriptional regulator
VSSKTAQAYRRLKVLIEAGHLGAGQRVTEAKAAEMVGLSRGPVRESLLRLEAEGLLKHKGTRRSRTVAYTEDQNPEEMLQRYELREQIESGAARLASKYMTGWQIDRLMELARQVDEAERLRDRDARHDVGLVFHQFLLANCGNPLFLEIWRAQRLTPTQPRSPELEDMILGAVDAMEDGFENTALVRVVEAIAAHDPDRAESLMKRRIHSITEALRKTVRNIHGNGAKKSSGGARS